MATSTTNLGLIKPSGSDKIRIAQINQNSDTLDAAIGAVGATSLQTQVNNVQDALAIIANGDTHAAITAGQFVYVKNNTHSVAEGLHVATANISANGQITTSNVSADASGGLNALNSKIAMHSSSLSGADSGTTVNAIKYNYDFAFITFTSANKTWAEGDSFGTLPVGAYPTENIRTTGNMYGSNIGVQIRIGTDGSVKYDSQNSVSGRISFTAMYVIAH